MITQEEKDLLLKGLCARLPYGVKCKWAFESYTGGGELCDIDHVKTSNGYRYWDCYFEDEGDDIPIELVKPYLRPMSSMTEEERKEYERFSHLNIGFAPILMDWIYSHHLDCCGLIPKGLALEAPEGMYK